MPFLIADTFTDALTRLPAADQKRAKTTAFDLQVDPTAHGLRLHRVDRAKDPNFWTARVDDDLRIVLHRTGDSVLLCWVDRHDAAYRWAERRRIDVHPTTGAAQIVEVRERAEEVVVRPANVGGPAAARKPLFATASDDALLALGVPPDWLEVVRTVDDDGLFALADHLPAEAVEALLDLATGGRPAPRTPPPAGTDPFAHPDAQRRFRPVATAEELRQALDWPWDRWLVFLHPSQRDLVERRFGGPARVMGSAGTGKTVVALHRAVHLARRGAGERVLLATFSKSLAHALRLKLRKLVPADDPIAGRIVVDHVDGVAHRLFQDAMGAKPNIASAAQVDAALRTAAAQVGTAFGHAFVATEWRTVVDAWQIRDWPAYRDVTRLGRRVRIGGQQREALWRLFEIAQLHLRERNVVTWAQAVARVTEHFAGRAARPFTAAVVDEAQDVSIPQLRMLRAIVPDAPDALFFAGDIGQRIFQHPFSWLSQGVDVRGRSVSLKVNYRTSQQIRRQADRLLPPAVTDVDGVADRREGIVSTFQGPEPEVVLFDDAAEEIETVGTWIADLVAGGLAPEHIGVFVRSEDELERARKAARASRVPFDQLDDRIEETPGRLVVGTMHLAKGQEFRAVAVMACDEDVIPLQSRIEAASEESELDEIQETERHLLYVACTRARERLLVSGVAPGSEFLGDLRAG